ncbi:MAG: hypothetical protein CMH91_13295 [Oceanicaulis sp.]|uniref:DUF6134 family protein n=1 Tax=unclassified Oceanicaulis TaxID=2632123 RepID=UPI000C66C9D9|nr:MULTISPECIES: DUF6134 family protein [unclassified Oceanicaulis]MBC40020.1 hypothetical protein [Oceanicaulis sp.]MBG37128.1 hypothetical protein [Oceanicaulis sp.]HBU62603.1 hypothetical protein [Oceanicaulis sp.]
MFRSLIMAAAAVATCTPLAFGAFEDGPVMPLPDAGERIVFDVYRNGDTRFGTHALSFTQDGQDLLVNIDIELRAGLGPVTVFRYEHQSTERWREGQLVGLVSETLKDGDTYEVSAQSSGEALDVQGMAPEDGPISLELPLSILPSSHWHGYRPGEYDILNTEYGNELDVTVEYLGEEMLEADGERIPARRYRLISDLTVDLWYDENGRWAGCEFEARGQTVRYVRRADPLEG